MKISRIIKKILMPILLGFLIIKLMGCGNTTSNQPIIVKTTSSSSTKPIPSPNFTQEDIEKRAKETTVFITSGRGEPGSGVIISKNDDSNTYYVLTASHVVFSKLGNDDDPYMVQTNDNQQHRVAGSEDYDQKITLFDSNVDLALIEFTAEKGQTYSVAPLTESLSVGKPVYAFGWKSCSPDSKNFQFTKGAICKVKASLGYGRDMRYTNNIIKGVSGGPIFDSQGRVLAIQSALADERGKQICESMPIEPDDNFSDGIGVSISEHIMPLKLILQNKSSIELKNDTSLETSNSEINCREIPKSCPPILAPGDKGDKCKAK